MSFEQNQVEIHKLGRKKALHEEDEEEVFSVIHQPSFNPEVVASTGTSQNIKQRRVPVPNASTPSAPSEPITLPSKSNSKIYIILVAILVIFGLTYWQLNKTHTERVKIKQVTWEHTVHVSEFREAIRSDFDVPVGGKILSSVNKLYQTNEIIHKRERCSTHLEDVPDHKEYSHTNSKVDEDGTVRKKDVYRVVTRKEQRMYCWDEKQVESVPEYRPYYTYSIMEWQEMPPLKTEGEGKSTPRFAEVVSSPTRRVDSKIALYKGKFEASNHKIHEYKMDLGMYEKAKKNIGNYCEVTWSYVDLKKLEC